MKELRIELNLILKALNTTKRQDSRNRDERISRAFCSEPQFSRGNSVKRVQNMSRK